MSEGEYRCNHCDHNSPRNQVEISNAGHIICYDCIEKIIKANNRNQIVSSLHPDKTPEEIDELIDKLKVRP